jgi:hypothetical protein
MLFKAFDWLVMAKNVEALHWAGKDAFGSDMDFTEAE